MQPSEILVTVAASVGLCALGYLAYLLGQEAVIGIVRVYRAWQVRRDVSKWERARDKELRDWRATW